MILMVDIWLTSVTQRSSRRGRAVTDDALRPDIRCGLPPPMRPIRRDQSDLLVRCGVLGALALGAHLTLGEIDCLAQRGARRQPSPRRDHLSTAMPVAPRAASFDQQLRSVVVCAGPAQ